MSAAMAAAGVGRTSIACQCTSMRPGMSVRPPPSIMTASGRWSAGIGAEEIRSILFPRTSTCEGPESRPTLPSKMRTFWNTVAADGCVCALSEAVSPHARTKTTDLTITIGALSPGWSIGFVPGACLQSYLREELRQSFPVLRVAHGVSLQPTAQRETAFDRAYFHGLPLRTEPISGRDHRGREVHTRFEVDRIARCRLAQVDQRLLDVVLEQIRPA